MEIFLNGSSKETLQGKERPKTTVSYFLEMHDPRILCPCSCDGLFLDLTCVWACCSTYSNTGQLDQSESKEF